MSLQKPLQSILTVILILSFTQPAFSQATKKPAKPTPRPSKQHVEAAAVLENASPQTLPFFAALKGFKQEDIRFIKKKLPVLKNQKPARLELKNDELLIDGARTGVKVSSYSPLNIQYKGRIWVYEKSKTLEQNFNSLEKFLTVKPVAGRGSFWINAAYAEDLENEIKGSVLGAAGALAMVGLIVGVSGVAIAAAPAVIIFGLVGAIGAGFGWIIGQQTPETKPAQLSIMANIDSNLAVQCSPEAVELKTAGGEELSIRKHNGSFMIRTGPTVQLAYENLPDNQKAAISQMAECDSVEEAAILKHELIAAANAARAETRAQGGDTTSGSAVSP